MRALWLFLLLALPLRADEIVVEWHKETKATKYELEVQQKEKVVFNQTFGAEKTSWTGNLPTGSYLYRLRFYDARGRVSPWSSPIPFFVTPPPPTLLIPPNNSTVLFKPEIPVAFKWTKVEGARKYTVTLLGGPAPQRLMVEGTQATVPDLKVGEYSWSVKPVLETTIQGKTSELMDLKTSETFRFKLELVKDGQKYTGDFQKLRLAAYRSGAQLEERDLVCLYKEKEKASEPVACGKVSQSQGKNLILRLMSQSRRIENGDNFFVAPLSDDKRAPASVIRQDDLYQVVEEMSLITLQASAGVMAGLTYFFPAVSFQLAVLPSLGVGVRGFLSNDQINATTKASLTGLSLIISKYWQHKNFSGPFTELGVGPYFFSAENSTSAERARMSMAGQLSLGWHIRPAQSNLSASVALGAQYIDTPKITLVNSAISGFLPLCTLLVGYAF